MPEEDSVPAERDTAEGRPPEAEIARVAHVQVEFDVRLGSRVQVTVTASALSQAAVTIVPDIGDGQAGGPLSPPAAPAMDVIASLAPAGGASETQGLPSPAAASGPALGSALRALGQRAVAQLRALAKLVGETRLWRAAQRWPLPSWLFALALLLYLGTRLYGLEDYPIYFFSDEAVHTVRAAELATNGFMDSDGVFLPTYLLNYPFHNLSVSVYVQVLPYLLFGKTIFVTRATSVLITLLAALAVGLALRDIFNIPYWWSGVLLLSVTPAWFLHSRTAFEVVEMTAFYAAALYFYWLYRQRAPRYLYLALVFGALAFYTYSPAQLVIPATAAVLLVSDWRYHWQNRKTILVGLLVTAVLALPYVRFQLAHPSLAIAQLRERGSWLVQPIPLGEKLGRSLSEYAASLNPLYWYGTKSSDLPRHIMQGYGHLWIGTLPFAVLGLMVALWRWRSATHRALVLAWLVSPSGAWLAEVGITRVLMLVIPATLLTALGLASALQWLERWRPFTRQRISAGLFVLLGAFSVYLLRDALVNGPTWSRDYGLYGMQYGARQVFGELIPNYLTEHTDVKRLHVSPVWANGTGTFADFFLSPSQQDRVILDSLDTYLKQRAWLTSADAEVLTAPEYETARASPKFKTVQAEQILNYPDGSPGFYVVRLAYVDNVDAIFGAEAEGRRQLAEGQAHIGSQTVTVRYSQINAGSLADIFDGNWNTLVRGVDANPFVFEFLFPEPRPVTGIAADLGSMDLTMTVSLYGPGSDTPVKVSQSYRNQPPDPHVEMDFDNAPAQVSRMRVEIASLLAGDTANIHVREFKVLP